MKVLLLAGSGESRRLASLLAKDDKFEAIASLAGATRFPKPLPLETRVGGFGSRAQQLDYLRAGKFEAVVDATHPFAAQISQRTSEICQEISMPCIHVLRLEWEAGPRDDWTLIDAPEEAAEHIPNGVNVFLATGRSTLSGFANLSGRRLICRQIDPPEAPFPFENGEYLVGRPPFSVADEIATFRKFRIAYLVVKNAGGLASRTKLGAAADLGIKVLMIRRPQPPKGEIASSVEAALDWLHRL